MTTRNDHANRAANELATVLTRLLDVAESRPQLVDASTADKLTSLYSADFYDAIAWARSAFEEAISALPRTDPQKPFMLEWLEGYTKRLNAL